jgi:HD-like signal output (HDOD) protein
MASNPNTSSGTGSSVFEDLLPHSTDPAKEKLRLKLATVLSSKAEVLPAAESPLGRLWRLVNSPSSTLAECEEIILLDPALTSRIFSVANSAAYHANASTVSEAIRFVGFKCIREFAFSAGVFSQFSDLAVPEGWDIFWLRNIFVARMTERIASIFGPTDGSDYLAGLIHDVGWIFLAAYAPEEFDEIWRYKGRIADAEHEILPFGHTHLGAAVAAKSRLPLRTVDAILYHHRRNLMANANLTASTQSPLLLATIMGVADRLADACQLDLFARVPQTVKDVLAEPEVVWLKHSGKQFDLEAMAKEEVQKAQDIYTAFFDDTSAGR